MAFENLSSKTRRLTLKDGYYIIAILVLYCIVSFFHLGSMKNPQTFWIADGEGKSVTLDLGNVYSVSKIRYYTGPRFGEYGLYISNDNKVFNAITPLEEKKVFFWEDVALNQSFRYLRIVEGSSGSIGEIGFYDEEGRVLPVTALEESGKVLVDEQDQIPKEISYLNTTYFDEIYHARTAYEYIHGMTIYEWTHPPLGKLIMTIPIMLFGMNTFSYRLAGNIAGIIMLVIIYIFAKRIFKETKYAALAMLLFAVDGMHFVQTRIGTVDSFLVLFILLAYLFMYQYTCCNTKHELSKMHINLFLSGLFMAAAISTKWNGAYSAVGLAIIFFIDFFKRNNEGGFHNKWQTERMKIILACFGYFVFIPIIVYVASFIPDMIIEPEYRTISGFIKLQERMFNYHSGLDATHPFSSSWYLWPLGIKPLWYYKGEVAEGMVSTISLHSNPFIWWTGIILMLYTFVKAVIDRSKRYTFLSIAILASYIPYILIPRIMYIYHYFPVIPFMILAIVGGLKDLDERVKFALSKWYAIIAISIFVFFYPIYSGFVIPEWYALLTEWLPMWQLY